MDHQQQGSDQEEARACMAPSAFDEEEAPSASEEEGAPSSSDEEKEAPSASEEEEAPSASEEEEALSASAKEEAPLASEEEEEQAPASPEQQQATVNDTKKKIEEALISCSETLEAACRCRVKGDLELRCLALLKKEMSHIIASVTELSPQHADEETMLWVGRLTAAASRTLDGILSKRHTLLGRVEQCIRNRYRVPLQVAEKWAGLPRFSYRFRLPVLYQSVYLLQLYLSMFPYGHMFEKHRLVLKWCCEGIFNEGCFGTSTTEIQRNLDLFFSYLVDKNVITHAASNPRRNILDEDKAWQWKVSHLKHRSLASNSAKIGFIFTSDTLNLLAAAAATDHYANQASRIPRRLALHHDVPNMSSLLQNADLSQTRSLAVSGAVSIGVPLDKFVDLVVLDVEGWENFGDDDLLQLCRSKMFFLKYLSIRSTRVSKLPLEMKELRSLQVLDASYTLVSELQFIVLVATRLYRLDLRGTPIRQLILPMQLGRLLHSLEILLLDGGEGMINSAAKATRVPHDIRRFLNLSTLATIDLSEQPATFVKALGDLQNLRVVAITWSFHQSSDRDYCEALLSSIERWSSNKLESLTIHCGLGCSMEFLGSISYMTRRLETFKVTVGRFAGVPDWFHWLELSFVQITVCKLGDRDLEILGGLPLLKCLTLGLDFIPREAIIINRGGFNMLQRFSIDCHVPWLIFVYLAMPKLTCLQLDFCSSLSSQISVPLLGISKLDSLTEVSLWYNVRYTSSPSVKMTVEAVRKEIAKCRRACLFINGIQQDDVQAVDEETQNATGTPRGTGAGAEDAVEAVHDITEA